MPIFHGLWVETYTFWQCLSILGFLGFKKEVFRASWILNIPPTKSGYLAIVGINDLGLKVTLKLWGAGAFFRPL